MNLDKLLKDWYDAKTPEEISNNKLFKLYCDWISLPSIAAIDKESSNSYARQHFSQYCAFNRVINAAEMLELEILYKVAYGAKDCCVKAV